MEKILIEKNTINGYRSYRVPGVISTGKSVIVYYEGRHGADNSVMDILMRRYENGVLSERKVLVSGEGRNTIHNATMFVKDGKIHLLWHKNYRQLFHQISYDDGKTFSAPRNVSSAYDEKLEEYCWTVVATGAMHGTILSNGRLIVPIWLVKNLSDRTAHRPSVISTLYSNDDGLTWYTGELIKTDDTFKNPSEAVIAELSNGKVILNFRHEGETSYRAYCISDNGIKGWSAPRFDYSLPCPICNAGMSGTKDKIFFANCNCFRNYSADFSGVKQENQVNTRKNLTVYKSVDDCKSWEKIKMIAENGGYCDLFYDELNNTLYCVAEEGRKPGMDVTWHFTDLTLNIFKEKGNV